MLDWLANAFNELIDFLYALVLTVFDILKEFFFWILEQLFDFILLLLNGVGLLFDGLDIAQYIGMIPPSTAHIMSQIGFSQAMGMIVTCLTIRFFLQLIPFVRLGS